MNSEKVKEIKKALEDNANDSEHTHLAYIEDYRVKLVAYRDILTLINELESENDCKDIEISKQEYQIKKLKDRIVELEKQNARLLNSVETVQSNRCVYKCELTKKQLKQFAEKVLKFVKGYAFKDSKEIYTNGTILVPLFRVEYALETGGQDYQQG